MRAFNPLLCTTQARSIAHFTILPLLLRIVVSRQLRWVRRLPRLDLLLLMLAVTLLECINCWPHLGVVGRANGTVARVSSCAGYEWQRRRVVVLALKLGHEPCPLNLQVICRNRVVVGHLTRDPVTHCTTLLAPYCNGRDRKHEAILVDIYPPRLCLVAIFRMHSRNGLNLETRYFHKFHNILWLLFNHSGGHFNGNNK